MSLARGLGEVLGAASRPMTARDRSHHRGRLGYLLRDPLSPAPHLPCGVSPLPGFPVVSSKRLTVQIDALREEL